MAAEVENDLVMVSEVGRLGSVGLGAHGHGSDKVSSDMSAKVGKPIMKSTAQEALLEHVLKPNYHVNDFDHHLAVGYNVGP